MPEILSNTQNQQLTTSDNGRNVRPTLIANSHFYIESAGDGAFGQTTSQKFGAISETQFRTSAKVTFSGIKKVFAICQGQIFVVPQQGNTTKVNVILRPYKQPIRELPIKYFIYRGLKKSDFISGTGVNANIVEEASSNSGFIARVWSEFNAFYSHLPEDQRPEDFKASMIGFSDDTTLHPDEKLIDHYLNKISVYDDDDQQNESELTQFELPLIPQGTHLGDLDGSVDGGVSLDIVLNKGDYYIENDTNPFQFNLAFARAIDHVLDTNVITETGDQGDYQKKLIKEACIQFMDVAAFYGLHCNGQGKFFVNNSEAPLTAKGDIYQHLKNFNTAHTQYLYIQSNRQRSYNFYNNYKHPDNDFDLKIGAAKDNVSETTFGTQNWPINTLENQENTYIQLTTDNYDGAGLFVKLGNIITEHEENFVRDINLLQQPSEDESNLVDTNYSKFIGFRAIVENTNAISQCIQLIYEGKELVVSEFAPPPEPGQDPIESQQFLLKDIDDVFGLINAESFTKTKTNVIELPSVIEEELQIINFPNKQQGNDIGVIKTKRIADTIQISEDETIQRFTYETLLFNIKNINNSYLRNNSSVIDKASAGTQSFSNQQNNFYQPSSPYYLKTQLFTDGNETITGLLLETFDSSIPTKKILGITKDENFVLKSLIADYELFNCKIFFDDKLSRGDYYVSLESKNYKFYNLGILGETSEGKLNVYYPDVIINVYEALGYVYASKAYAEAIPNLNSVEIVSHDLKPEYE